MFWPVGVFRKGGRRARLGQQTEQKNPIIVSALCRRMCASGLGQKLEPELQLESKLGLQWDCIIHTHTCAARHTGTGEGLDMDRHMSGVETVDE